MPGFVKLNLDWNAEPNAPDPRVELSGTSLALSFLLNPWAHLASVGERGCVTFTRCSRWRWDITNDHGWYGGTGRYAGIAPEWGEFYEIVGDDPERDGPGEWQRVGPGLDARHFLFYFRDETFECFARDWTLRRDSPARPGAAT
jgi:hypothetical protein